MNYTIAGFYNRLYFLYPVIDYFLKRQKQALFEAVNNVPAGKLLEVGVGNGGHLHLYQRHQITGIDIAATMLNRARQLHPAADLQLMNGEQLTFPDDSFDYVVMSHVLAVTDHPDRLLSEAHRVLKTDGQLFILNHFTPDNPLKVIDWVLQPVGRLLHLRSYFQIEQVQGVKRFLRCAEMKIGSYYKLFIFRKS